VDEFDDEPPSPLPSQSPRWLAGQRRRRIRFLAARLVSRVYSRAGESLRAQMLACLLRPLGTLGLAAVASGAFGRLLHRQEAPASASAIDDPARFSSDQVLELARFVQEVSPQTLEQIGALLAGNAMGVAAMSASALMLLYRQSRDQPADMPPSTG